MKLNPGRQQEVQYLAVAAIGSGAGQTKTKAPRLLTLLLEQLTVPWVRGSVASGAFNY